MAFEEIKENAEDIQEQAKNYFETNIAYYKLQSFKMAMKSTSMILKFLVMLLCLGMVLLFCSFALAFEIANYLGSYPLGFLIVGGIYLVGTGILYFFKGKIIEKNLIEKFSKIFFND